VALGFIVPAIGTNYLFSHKSMALFFIDAAYWLLFYTALFNVTKTSAQDVIDPGRMAITGTSYGGIMSMDAVAFAPGYFQAAIPMSGYGNFLHMKQEQELRHIKLLEYEFGPLEDNEEVYRRFPAGQTIAGPQMSIIGLDGSERTIIPGFFYGTSMDRTGTLIAAAHFLEGFQDLNPTLEIYSGQTGQPVLALGPGSNPQFQP